MSEPSDVNPHYLNRVVEVAETAGVEATEDIISGSGLKLLAKGARIDVHMRERLLQHKLRKPLESSLRVIDPAGRPSLDRVAGALLERHALLRALCGEHAVQLLPALGQLPLSTSVASMLSVFAAQGERKQDHAVGVALLAAAFAQGLHEGRGAGLQTLLVAGLLHDSGELYIDPAILKSPVRLDTQQWRHVAAHPIIAARVLREMPGAGAAVSDAVLCHHERLDGFGYPRGLSGGRLPLPGQLLAAAEMLMGIIEMDRGASEHASVALKLIPGEFDRQVVDRVTRVAAALQGAPAAEGADGGDGARSPMGAEELAQRAGTLGVTLQHLLDLRGDIESSTAQRSAAVRALMAQSLERCRCIRLAFSSTGLDMHDPAALREHVAQMDPRVQFEISVVIREIEWRLREIKREARVRAMALPPAEAALVTEIMDRSKRIARAAEEAAASAATAA
jgi:HD-GYP domain-containing protein (c-di-GMP phosphodiesterase class II)